MKTKKIIIILSLAIFFVVIFNNNVEFVKAESGCCVLFNAGAGLSQKQLCKYVESYDKCTDFQEQNNYSRNTFFENSKCIADATSGCDAELPGMGNTGNTITGNNNGLSNSGTCKTGYESEDGTCYNDKTKYCEEVNDTEICGSSANPNGKTPDKDKTTTCSTGLEDEDNKCYSNKTEYCAAVDDTDICGEDAGDKDDKKEPKKTNSTNNTNNSTDNSSTSCTSASCTFGNPVKYNNVNEFATNVLSTIRSIIVVLSMIFLILGGIFYITSAGDDTRMKAAKGAIAASMIGLAIGVAAPSFLKEIYAIMGGKDSGIENAQLSGLSLTQIALNFLNFLLSVVGILALIMLIVGGIMYLTSAGDDDRIQTAKKIITYSVIGIAISLAALVIVRQIANLLK